MNNKEARKEIASLKEEIDFLQSSSKRFTDQMLKLQKKIDSFEQTKSEFTDKLVALETELANEMSAKRSVMRLLKQYPQLDLDDESDHDEGERGTYLWLYGPFDGDDESDPYYDEHYMDDWVECYQRCLTYVECIKNNLSVTEET